MLHKDQPHNIGVVVKDIIGSFLILWQLFKYTLMVSFNLLHDVLWVKQQKLLDNSIRFYQEKVPASFEVHEPVPWDKEQYV